MDGCEGRDVCFTSKINFLRVVEFDTSGLYGLIKQADIHCTHRVCLHEETL